MLKYQIIENYIRNEISIGNLKPKRRLPALRSMANLFECSIGTALKACESLEKQHLVYSVPKSGYFVMESRLTAPMIQGAEEIDFSSGAPDSNTLPYQDLQHCLNNAIELYKDQLFSYGDPKGLPVLIDAISKHSWNNHLYADPSQIVVTTGSQQALSILASMPFPNGKTHVLLEQPTYYGMIKLLELNGIPTIGVSRGFEGLDLNELETRFRTGNVKFFYTIPRFHNPTGTSYSQKEKAEILQLATKYDVYIVEDDVFSDFDSDSKREPLYSTCTSDMVIYLKSYSKVLAPGLRIASVVLPKLLLNTFVERKRWSDMMSPALSQGALEIYMRSGMFDQYSKRLRELYARRMSILQEVLAVNRHQDMVWNVPESGFFACVKVQQPIDPDNALKLLAAQGIILLDTRTCFLNEYRTSEYFRISISKTSEESIRRGIPIVVSVLNRCMQRTGLSRMSEW